MIPTLDHSTITAAVYNGYRMRSVPACLPCHNSGAEQLCHRQYATLMQHHHMLYELSVLQLRQARRGFALKETVTAEQLALNSLQWSSSSVSLCPLALQLVNDGLQGALH